MYPVVEDRNRTPSSTAELSLTVTVLGVDVLAQMVQGQADPVAPVVNDQENAAIVLPLGSFAPLTVAVCTVVAARAAVGVNVTVWLGASYATLPGTAVWLPTGPDMRVMPTVPAWMGSLNVAVTVV